MKLMKEQAISSRPKDMVSSVSAKIGGVMGAFAPGQPPRGEMQVSNVKRSLAFSCNQGDELYVMMQQSKAGDDFVRDIKSTPDPAIVIAAERQLDDLVRFRVTPAGTDMSILIVDPTFCLGDFECTPITYLDIYFWLPIGTLNITSVYQALFDSLQEELRFFPLFFANSLISRWRRLEALRCFGTDEEKVLVDAFLHEFRSSIHLYCHIHARANVENEFHMRRFVDSVVHEFVGEIFGKQVGSAYCEGLVDA